MFEYKALVTGVYDGDTVTADIDLGFHIWMRDEKIRLLRINAPELRGDEREAGIPSRDILRHWILDKEVTIRTEKDKKGKYGRWLAEIFLDGENINDKMVEMGYAVYAEY